VKLRNVQAVSFPIMATNMINTPHWLAYVGRTGEWLDPIGIQVGRPPLMPAHGDEWVSFTGNISGFGNSGASWVSDTSEVD